MNLPYASHKSMLFVFGRQFLSMIILATLQTIQHGCRLKLILIFVVNTIYCESPLSKDKSYVLKRLAYLQLA
jgi:hypothetical protein